MFDINPKSLIVVCKNEDELVLNQLRKFVETNEDDIANNEIISTKDDGFEIVPWNEKMWLDQKKAGVINGNNVLFIGIIKGTDKLEPIIDVKYDKWGIKYGWAGKQALINVDTDYVNDRAHYDAFLKEFKKTFSKYAENKNLKRNEGFCDNPKKIVLKGLAYGPFGLGLSLFVDYFKDKSKLRQQLLLYGISELYYNDLKNFMKV
ncbi:hypothetical protein [Oribacterium sp. NK2B42]|uniref:hypothetical protein n=1 Tax=Oribacterium sp. NK2B42 TaxID=689781 RepID=UPI00041E61E7|nr:hypothetical protein [Oribacterium sp. NK2B42]